MRDFLFAKLGDESRSALDVSMPTEGELSAIDPTLETHLRDLPKAVLPPLPDLPASRTELRNGNRYTTTTERMVRNLTSLTALQPMADILWPGSLVRGDSIYNVPTPLNAPRTPYVITLSYVGLPSMGNPLPSISGTVQNPSLATASDTVRALLHANAADGLAPVYSGLLEEYRSERELSFFLQGSYSGATASIQAALSVNRAESERSFMIMLTQTYYTVSVEAPWKLADWFRPGVTRQDFEFVLGQNAKSPAYISTVSYGRMLIASAVTRADSMSLREKLSAAFNGLASNGKIDQGLTMDDTVRSTTFRIAVVGGPTEHTPSPIGGFEAIGQIEKWFQAGAVFSRKTVAFPIGYSFRWLCDNSFAEARLTAEFERTEVVPQRVVRLGVRFQTTDFSKDADEAVTVEILVGNDVVWRAAPIAPPHHEWDSGSSQPDSQDRDFGGVPGWFSGPPTRTLMGTGWGAFRIRVSKEDDPRWSFKMWAQAWLEDGTVREIVATEDKTIRDESVEFPGQE